MGPRFYFFEIFQMPIPRLGKAVFLALISSFIFLNSTYACERPVFKRNVFLGELSQSGFRIDWTPVANAKFYELKYVARIPEGRTLAQREVIATKPFHTFLADELPQGESLQLIVEVMAQCDTAKSNPAFAQIALKNPASGCRFDQQFPALKNDELSWPPVKGAYAYLLCFHTGGDQTSCKETTDTHNRTIPRSTSLIGITPLCNNVAGTPAYLSTKILSDLPDNSR
jgi:hypothetical protein